MRPRKKMLVYCQSEDTAGIASFALQHVELVAVTVATECLDALYHLDVKPWDLVLVMPTDDNLEEDLEVLSSALAVSRCRVILARRSWATEYRTAWPCDVHACASNMYAFRAVVRLPMRRGPKPIQEWQKLEMQRNKLLDQERVLMGRINAVREQLDLTYSPPNGVRPVTIRRAA